MTGRPQQLRQGLAVGRASSPQEALVQLKAMAGWELVGHSGVMIPACSARTWPAPPASMPRTWKRWGVAKLPELLLSLSEGDMDVMLR